MIGSASPSNGRSPPSRVLLILLTLLNVGLQLGSAALIKFASIRVDPTLAFLAVVMAIVLALNFGRFLVWGRIHRRYPVSFAYPLSALFFPAVVLLAWWTGEQVGPWQVGGAAMVMAGTILVVLGGSAGTDKAGLTEPVQ